MPISADQYQDADTDLLLQQWFLLLPADAKVSRLQPSLQPGGTKSQCFIFLAADSVCGGQAGVQSVPHQDGPPLAVPLHLAVVH